MDAESGYGEVKRSRSGRLLKAPMAAWSGEHIVYDARGEPISLVAPVTATQAYKDAHRGTLVRSPNLSLPTCHMPTALTG